MGATAKTSDTKRKLQDVHKEWVSALEHTLGLKPSKIATEAGLSDTTLTRLFWPDYGGTLSQMTIAKVKARFGVAGPGETSEAGATIPGFSEGDRVLFSNDNGGS